RPQGVAWCIGASEAVPPTANSTEMDALNLSGSGTQFIATATFTGDNDANNSAVVYYCNNTVSPGCSPLTSGSSMAMSRSGGQFTATVTGLVTSDVYSAI